MMNMEFRRKPEGFNGWTNRATWSAHLWLSSGDEFTSEQAFSRAATEGTTQAAWIRWAKGVLRCMPQASKEIGRFSDVNWPEVYDAFSPDD